MAAAHFNPRPPRRIEWNYVMLAELIAIVTEIVTELQIPAKSPPNGTVRACEANKPISFFTLKSC